MTAILLFSLTFIAALSGESLIKGLIAGLFGFVFSTVGMEIETATVRLTFDILELYDGLSLIPVAIGMLAVAEMLVQLGGLEALERQQKMLKGNIKAINQSISWEELKLSIPAIIRGTVVGSTIAILPGLGVSVPSFLSYGLTKKAAKDPSRFGKGAIEGIAAAESADNAVVPSSLVPLFALSIPGSVSCNFNWCFYYSWSNTRAIDVCSTTRSYSWYLLIYDLYKFIITFYWLFWSKIIFPSFFSLAESNNSFSYIFLLCRSLSSRRRNYWCLVNFIFWNIWLPCKKN